MTATHDARGGIWLDSHRYISPERVEYAELTLGGHDRATILQARADRGQFTVEGRTYRGQRFSRADLDAYWDLREQGFRF